jgi:hypothetical protein
VGLSRTQLQLSRAARLRPSLRSAAQLAQSHDSDHMMSANQMARRCFRVTPDQRGSALGNASALIPQASSRLTFHQGCLPQASCKVL